MLTPDKVGQAPFLPYPNMAALIPPGDGSNSNRLFLERFAIPGVKLCAVNV